MQVRVAEDGKKFGSCGCGRSPTGECIGWHGLTEEDYREKLAEWDANEVAKRETAETYANTKQ